MTKPTTPKNAAPATAATVQDAPAPAADAAVEAETSPKPDVDASAAKGTSKPTKRNRRAEQALSIRKVAWPKVGPERLWILDGKRGGFAQVPRTLSLLMHIIGAAVKKKTGKSSAAASTYLVLWLHSYGEGVARVESEEQMAFEAGYGGERSKSTFRGHMKVLEDLGFIAHSGGARSPFEWVLMYNPYQVLHELNKQGLVQDRQYTAMVQLLDDIGSSKELRGVDDE
jgi:hypothetical protein